MTDKKPSEIKNCPFCGNDDPLDDDAPEDEAGVCCGASECPIEGVVFTRREWNTRADLAEKPVDDAEVREAVDSYREAYDWLVDNGDDHRSLPDARAAFGTIFEAIETLIRAATAKTKTGEYTHG